jgi:hypothetical protein
MRAIRVALLLGAMCISGIICPAQTLLELKPSAILKVPNHAYGIPEPIQCDSSSNIYFQAYEKSDSPGRIPITRLSPDGKTRVFPLPALDNNKKLGILYFAPEPDGGVALLTTDYAGNYYVETYQEDGQFDSRFTLPPELDPMQMAVSPQGKILLCGLWSTSAPGRDAQNKPFAAVFDSKGKEERDVDLEDPPAIEAGAPAARSGSARAGMDRRKPFMFSSVQFAENGNFVLARLQSHGPIYVITPDGFEVNSFYPAVPPDTMLSSIQTNGDTIAALFVKKKPGSTQNEISDVYITLFSAQTGDEMGRYHHSSWKLGAALACYEKGVFTFLTTGDNDELQLVRATAK